MQLYLFTPNIKINEFGEANNPFRYLAYNYLSFFTYTVSGEESIEYWKR